MESNTISAITTLPAPLYEAMVRFVEDRSDWDGDRVYATAIAQFLSGQPDVREQDNSLDLFQISEAA